MEPKTLLALALLLPAPARAGVYAWRPEGRTADTVESRFPPPPGFSRVPAEPGSFAEWLRGLPLKPAGAPVLLHDGRRKARQDVHAAVVDLDVGPRDLQQCADAVMRLRAEYFYGQGRFGEIAFDYTSGDRVPYGRWRGGERPVVRGSRVRWGRAEADESYAGFRRYLDAVFTYAGSKSLERELERVENLASPRIGDVFIQGGFPGHAVLVVDTAQAADGRRVMLLAQSYMPAQEVHVLLMPGEPSGRVWYPVPGAGSALATPEWTFLAGSLRRFPGLPAPEGFSIAERPISFSPLREAATRDYAARHYGPDAGIDIKARMVVIHWTATRTLEEAWRLFDAETLPPGRADIRGGGELNVSAHFLVDRDGKVYRLMPETRMARHVIGLNHCAVGIENVGGAGGSDDLTPRQFAADAWLVRQLKSRHPGIEFLVGHHEAASFEGQGLWRERVSAYRTVKPDPGPAFMSRLRQELSDLMLRAAPSSPDPWGDVEEWRLCSADADCVSVPAACPGFWEGVHRLYAEAARRRSAEVGARIECQPGPESAPPPALCRERRCAAGP